MKKINVLVFPCGSEIGLEIHRSLCFAKNITLFGGSSVNSNHGKFVFENYFEGLPNVDDPTFIDELNLIIDKYNIDFVFPAHDSVVVKLSQYKDILHCNVVGSPYETCKLTRSKKKTYEFFGKIIKTPRIYKKNEMNFEFPVFLKPDIGQGSKGTVLVQCAEEMNFYLDNNPSLLVLEYLPGTEYTVDCFTDRNGELKFVGARERARVTNGISVNSRKVMNDDEFIQIAKTINDSLKFRGMWFFQLKRNIDGELSLLEISARVSGTMGFFRNLGTNLPLMAIFDLLGHDIHINVNTYSLEMDRALVSSFLLDLEYDNVYIDFDDTLILNEQVNTVLITFIFQCINQNKKLFLITRHKDDINLSLKKYKLSFIFGEVLHLKNGEHKSAYINPVNSIFIDDSFAERLEVSKKLGIPTFDLDSVESLISWKK